MTDAERTDAIYAILDEAVAEIEALGLEQPAPLRAMVSYILHHLPAHLCTRHLHEDLTRIAGMFAKEAGDLREHTH
jgi:hypothetical protein